MELKDVEKDEIKSGIYIGACFENDLKSSIINTDKAYFIVYMTNPAHWIGCYLYEDCFEVMDSMGIIYIYTDFCTFLYHNMIGKKLFVTPRLQSEESQNCGNFVKYFFQAKENGLSFYDILSNFSSNLTDNDKIINKLIK